MKPWVTIEYDDRMETFWIKMDFGCMDPPQETVLALGFEEMNDLRGAINAALLTTLDPEAPSSA